MFKFWNFELTEGVAGGGEVVEKTKKSPNTSNTRTRLV